MTKVLSICIPVYNCGEFIEESLDSILPQLAEDMEVVVFDGNSTDNTPQLMERYLKTWPQLRYVRALTRGGIDADMAHAVSLATGDYCWLFSGDDVMRPGAISKAIEWITRSGDDVYIAKHTLCNKQMRILQDYPIMKPDAVFFAELRDQCERRKWFQLATNTEAFFSFMSGLVIRRQKWCSGDMPPEFDGSCWGHVARLFSLIDTGLSVRYVAENWLDQRGENDSFADRGIVNRLRITIEGFDRLASTFFGESSLEAYHIRRVVRNEFGIVAFLSAKMLSASNPERESREMLDRIVSLHFRDASWTNLFMRNLYFLSPCWFLVGLKKLVAVINGKPK